MYSKAVYQFWNVNSLLTAACRMPSGVSLNLIRDPDYFHSYFAFAIRNGGNLILLSDLPKDHHPLSRYMSRRPDRAFDERAARNWFPYELLNIKYDEEQGRLYIDNAESEAKTMGSIIEKAYPLLKGIKLDSSKTATKAIRKEFDRALTTDGRKQPKTEVGRIVQGLTDMPAAMIDAMEADLLRRQKEAV